MIFYLRGKQRRIFKALKSFYLERHISESPINGPFLNACRKWLNYAFGSIHSEVIKEYPEYENKEGFLHPIFTKSDHYKYKTYFSESNFSLNMWIKSKVFASMKTRY